LAACDVDSPSTQRFSIGSMSIAWPYACSDPCVEPVAARPLNDDVLSVSIER
jgi:hypothetical protein